MADASTWVNIIDILWPVGSLYYCLYGTSNTPDTVLGGSWIEQSGGVIQVGNYSFTCYRRIA